MALDFVMPGAPGRAPGKAPVQMMQPRAGFVFKTRTLPPKGSAEQPRKVFINVVMHELVKRPLNASMEEVSGEHLDSLGLANLRVPLDVGEPRECEDNSGEKAIAIDVIFSPSLLERALQGPTPTVMGQPRNAYYQQQLASLACINVQPLIQDSFKVALDGTCCKLLKTGYKGGAAPAMFPWVDGMWSSAMLEGEGGLPGGGGGGVRESGDVLVTERIAPSELKEVGTRKMGDPHGKAAPVVKKGFLSGKNAGKLYENEDGSYGSTEQANAISDDERHLSHIPKSLRQKCAIVDTTKMNKDEIKDAMTQYAESGRVSSGPAAPKGLARKDPKFEEEFGRMQKKAGASSAPPEPTFALGGLKSKKPLKIIELHHTLEPVTEVAKEEEGAAAEGEQGGKREAALCPASAKIVGYKVTVTMPESITGMDDLDVEVSCHKVEIKCKDGTHALNLVWPAPIDPDALVAKFRKKLAKLVLSAPTADL